MIEKNTPADIYKDKSLFEDVDSIKDYYERFILRPIKSFLGAKYKPDDVYNVDNEEL